MYLSTHAIWLLAQRGQLIFCLSITLLSVQTAKSLAGDATEAAIIARTNGQVERNGADLIVHAKDQTVLHFRDANKCDGSDECVTYRLEDYIEDHHAFLISNNYMEDRDYSWVNDTKSMKIVIKGIPHFSPDRKRFAVVEPSESSYNGIQIFSMTEGWVFFEWEYVPQGYELYTFKKWEDNSAIALAFSTYINGKLTENLSAKLVYAAPHHPGWHLEGPLEALQ